MHGWGGQRQARSPIPVSDYLEVYCLRAQFNERLRSEDEAMTARLARLRNTQLDETAEYIGGSHRPTVVFGDFNITMWSSHYLDFVRKSGLRNARQGYGISATWPTSKVLGVPIDHVLYSNTMTAMGFRVLSSIGSDHLPVAAKIALGSQSVHGEAEIKLNRSSKLAVSELR